MMAPVNQTDPGSGPKRPGRADNVAELNTGAAAGGAGSRPGATELNQYLRYFGLVEAPFTITPDPRYLFLSRRHQEGMAHLLFGVGQGGSGGFVQLTGEVGTGKTTLCRCLLDQVPERTQIALILNPVLTPQELLAAICDELGVTYPDNATSKVLVDCLTQYLLQAYAQGERVVVVIDEAQNMSRGALEQVRLLTNLETATDKLLQIVLLGQPELRYLLAQSDLRQLAQRITARYHLEPLDEEETAAYIRHRLAVAGAPRCPLTARALRAVYQCSQGVPRLINIITDRALMGAYAQEKAQVSAALVRRAAREVYGTDGSGAVRRWRRPALIAVAGVAIVAVTAAAWLARDYWWPSMMARMPEAVTPQAPPAQNLPVAADRAALWQRYGELWRADGEQLRLACEDGASSGFLCLRQSGNWQRIQRLQLPVMLILDQGPGLLLLGIDDGRVLVHDGQQRHTVSEQRVEAHWLGEFWAVAPGRTGTLQAADTSPEVYRLKSLAAGLTSMPYAGPLDERFDPSLEHWGRAFQAQHGLRADGIVGPATRLYLAAEAVAEPRLLEEW